MLKEKDCEEIIKAVDMWWRGLRPMGWDKCMHLKNPAVNTTTKREEKLAKLIAQWHKNKYGYPDNS